MNFDNIGVVENGLLKQRFEKEKILQVVGNMEPDKASGPDGFTMTFFHHCWRVVESDILAFFEEFHEYGKFEKSMNASFIALIPKTHKASI